MKSKFFFIVFFPLFAQASQSTLLANSKIRCAYNYGTQGLYVVTSEPQGSQLIVYQQGHIVAKKVLGFSTDNSCYFAPEKPIAVISDSSNTKNLFNGLANYQLPKGSFAIDLNPQANIVKYWQEIPDEPELLKVSIAELNTGKEIVVHTLPKDGLNHTDFNFSADGSKLVLNNMDGSYGIQVLDTKTLKHLERIDYGNELSTSTQFLGNDLLTNLSGTVQLYQGNRLLWSYEHPKISQSVLGVSSNSQLISLSDDDGDTFTILDKTGLPLISVTAQNPLPNSQDYYFVQVMNDGFVTRSALSHDATYEYRIYNLESTLLRRFTVGMNDSLLIPASTDQDFYQLQKRDSINEVFSNLILLD